MDRKSNRDDRSHASRERQRKCYGNRYTLENKTSFASTSSEKLLRLGDREITIDNTHAYRILHLFSVFSTISTLVNCKTCNKDITFKEASSRGLGFKIAVTCECGTAYINSCPLINNAYEINRRIVMVMRLLGIDNEGLNLFCGLMDLAVEFYSQTYYSCLTNIQQASQAVYKILVKHAVDEEKQKTLEKKDSNVNLTVCGDGTWKKRGYSSLYGVTTLAGKYSHKIIDSVVRSSYCKMCEVWKKKAKNEEEFEEWKESHQELCTVNHDGLAGRMEVNSVKEMFERSIAEYGVKYTRYVGDGDSKIFKGILELNPYDVQVKKLECFACYKKYGLTIEECEKEKQRHWRKGPW
ncbi:hypothetical protein X777_16734 [Ooceraea biroi]|uniref:Mutator-like transposase domain-containing protein n=1 Tax=Ooceraea biroi TaxID=2015173 RepID=A0A026WUM5_OOCBI|nr:hypothetical protein X777_16734 [Ooceraea biroi]